MKEKRVDIYLALASFGQLALIGLISTFFFEIITAEPRLVVVMSSGSLVMISVVFTWTMYRRAMRLSQKKKRL